MFKNTSFFQTCLPLSQPTCARNALKSDVFFWQQDQYFMPSWKIGTPGWWTQDVLLVRGPSYDVLQPLFLQIVPIATSDGSELSAVFISAVGAVSSCCFKEGAISGFKVV